MRALTRKGQGNGKSEFLNPNHILAVVVVTDEEDCSIEDPGLFKTPEWLSGFYVNPSIPGSGHLNTACNYPPSNEEDFLYDVGVFYDHFIGLKGGNESAVVFAAIVGVVDGADSPCQGRGDELENCLDSPEMELREDLFYNPDNDGYFYHFVPS